MKDRPALILLILPALYMLGYPVLLLGLENKSFRGGGSIFLITGDSAFWGHTAQHYRPAMKLHAKVSGTTIRLTPSPWAMGETFEP